MSGSPSPMTSLTTSVACSSPIVTGSTPSTPLAPQEGASSAGGGRVEAAGAAQQLVGLEQLLLTLHPDRRDEQVTRVALALLAGERLGGLDLVAAVLPQRDAAGHRLDVLIAEQVLERVGGEGRALAGLAGQAHVPIALGHRALDARRQL